MPNQLSFAGSIKRIWSQSLEAKEEEKEKTKHKANQPTNNKTDTKNKVKKEWEKRKNLSDASPGSNSMETVTIKLFSK